MKTINSAIYGISIIWASVIFAVAFLLKGSSYFSDILPILGTGAAASLIILGGIKSKIEKQ